MSFESASPGWGGKRVLGPHVDIRLCARAATWHLATQTTPCLRARRRWTHSSNLASLSQTKATTTEFMEGDGDGGWWVYMWGGREGVARPI